MVDDRVENIEALTALITADDVNVLSATNAEEALQLLVNYEFALALLDVQMPGITGFELARLIRGVNRFRNLPVIFVTAHQREQSFIFEGYETGAVDLLFKPLDPHMVRSKVRVFVQLDQQARQLQDQMNMVEGLRQEAEGANLAKSRFLANMSHEIRTPLAAVLGFSDVLSQKETTVEERQQCVEALKRNGQLLLKIIDDILDLSKVEADRLEFEKIELDLQEVIQDVHAALALRAAEKGVQLQIHVDPSTEGVFKSDPIRIKQVLLNIIGNAIKFTAKGSVEAWASVNADNDAIFIVKDSGIGLTKEQGDRLFHPFSQADSSTQRTFGGSGLGLIIARQIARAMGGDVRLHQSELGRGSEFEVRFRLERKSDHAAPHAPAAGAGHSHDWKSKTILVVDDSEDNRSLVELYLKATGMRILQAGSGPDALAVFDHEKLDVVLMDIQMPIMDGHETTRTMRARGGLMPIIAFTAHAMREEAERCHESGCNTVLTKPITRGNLLLSLELFL